LHAQNKAITIQLAQEDSIVSATADAQGLELVPPDQIPRFGTFWVVSGEQPPAPLPFLPYDPASTPVFSLGTDGQFLVDGTTNVGGASATVLAAQADAVVNLIDRVQTTEANRQMRAMAMDVPSPGDGGNDGGSNNYSSFTSSYTIDTNGLWLEITNVSNGLACLNLHNSTDEVYEVWSKIDLLATNWNIEQEVWPEVDQEPTPFTVPVLDRTNLFIWARDWTGITSGGNETPEWWFWKYFGMVDLSDTNLDSQGNTLLYDYQNGADPNVISFSILFTNTLVNTSLIQGTITVSAGVPAYWAVLINDDNVDDADWQPYTSSNILVNLNAGDGDYAVWIGLRGLPADAHQTWLERPITLDTTPAGTHDHESNERRGEPAHDSIAGLRE
jgi:hypothetical protein